MGSIVAKRVGIQDIAREANVSITTVSHALNGKGRLSPEIRERVRLVAERLGYRANPQARGLATGRTMTLAVQVGSPQAEVLMPDFRYFAELLNAASARALKLGYGLLLAPAGASPGLIGELAIDGAIIVDPTGEEALLERTDVPRVTTGRAPGDADDVAWVDNDQRAGARMVLDHFARTGRSRPALLTTSGRQSYVEDAVAEYLDWCREHDFEPLVGRVGEVPTEAAATPAAAGLLSRRPRPDAIYATLDRMAVGALIACRSAGLSVPEDLAVAAITDTYVLRSADPPVTALDLNAPRIGREAVELLVGLVEGEEPSRAVTVPSRLVKRTSTQGTGPTTTGPKSARVKAFEQRPMSSQERPPA
jgi:DNA-binding LacI/PurR family transcriptional regulator